MQAQTLFLIRPHSLVPSEAQRLPRQFQVVLGNHPVLARADVVLSTKEIIQLAVQAGRAIPDCEVIYHSSPPPQQGKILSIDAYLQSVGGTSTLAHPVDARPVPMDDIIDVEAEVVSASPVQNTAHALATPQRSIFDRLEDTVVAEEKEPPKIQYWWEYVKDGQTDVALQMLQANPSLSHDEQIQARNLLNSDNPEWVVFICYAAKQFQWKPWVLPIRKMFTHEDYRVRKAAVAAVGDLAGPSLAPSVYPLLMDPHPEVQRVAQLAYKKLDR